MINVELNTNIGKSIMGVFFGLQVAVNNMNAKVLQEQKQNITRMKEIQDSKVNYDMRYKQTKDFLSDPLKPGTYPRFKQSQISDLDSHITMIYKNRERINSYNSSIASMKNTALYKQLRSTI